MNTVDLALIKEGLKLLDEAMQRFDKVQNNEVAHVLAKLVHGAVVAGELLIGG